jgi:hypothetical protein
VDCPLECEYLRQAREHERPAPLDPAAIPNPDIRVTQEFLQKNQYLVEAAGQILADAALRTPGAVDFDMREALESLVRSYRTLQSGIIYESLPANPLAASIHRLTQDALAAFRRAETQRRGMARTRDADVLGVLVFFQRIEYDRNNGRRRGRAFVDMLRAFQAPAPLEGALPPSSLILP